MVIFGNDYTILVSIVLVLRQRV